MIVVGRGGEGREGGGGSHIMTLFSCFCNFLFCWKLLFYLINCNYVISHFKDTFLHIINIPISILYTTIWIPMLE